MANTTQQNKAPRGLAEKLSKYSTKDSPSPEKKEEYRKQAASRAAARQKAEEKARRRRERILMHQQWAGKGLAG